MLDSLPPFRTERERVGHPCHPPSTKHLTTLYLVLHSISVIAHSSESAAPPSSPMDKWEVQLRKGCLELAILASLWPGRLYGLEILRLLEQDSDLVITEGTVYPLLSRLKAEGLLDSEWVEAEAGHPRKYYRLTPAGRRRAAAMGRIWSRFSASLNRLLSRVLKEEK
jgi:PadR family transcriptional regulator, regulatory protein PadR